MLLLMDQFVRDVTQVDLYTYPMVVNLVTSLRPSQDESCMQNQNPSSTMSCVGVPYSFTALDFWVVKSMTEQGELTPQVAGDTENELNFGLGMSLQWFVRKRVNVCSLRTSNKSIPKPSFSLHHESS